MADALNSEGISPFLQDFTPLKDDPLAFLITPDDELRGNGSRVRKGAPKEVSYLDIEGTLFQGDFLFQPMTPQEMNRHSLGERFSRFVSKPYSAPTIDAFEVITREVFAGHKYPTNQLTKDFYSSGGVSPCMFRIMRYDNDSVSLANDRTYLVGDVMLLMTAVDYLKSLSKMGAQDLPDPDFLIELAEARRVIEIDNGILPVAHNNYRPVVITPPYFDGKAWQKPSTVILCPGDTVLNVFGEVMYFLNKTAISQNGTFDRYGVTNRTFVTREGAKCKATTVEGYGKNLGAIRHGGVRSVVFGASRSFSKEEKAPKNLG